MTTDMHLDMQQSQRLSQSLQTTIRLLSLDLDALSEEIQRAASDNPALEYVPPQKSVHDYVVRVKTHYGGGHWDLDGISDIPAQSDTLRSDLEQQLRLSSQPKEVLRAAKCILNQLTPWGYFTQDLGEFAAESGVPLVTARRALAAVQALEPVGIGARTVEECLRLQLQERCDTDPLCFELIRLYLPEIGKGNIRRIAVRTGVSVDRVRQCVEIVRSLNPIPCSLREETTQYIMPEFSVESDDGKSLSIQFHNDYYPTLRQDETFLQLAKMLPEEERAYARRAVTSASQLIHAIEMRQSTMEKIAQIITREQHDFFLGLHNLVPLRIDEAAREIGVHETTVYRALQNKYLYCSRGTYPLNYFFQREVTGGSSTAAVKDMILALCREKGKMSDRAIAEALDKRGISLSRRTVAKYRAQMDVESSFRRGDNKRGENHENKK